ncbi:MAG: acetyl-CoA acetyltransferase [Actinobacteria bacterium]|nr:acetyl-CoA acetyltransferase [Actinomycetota bacterium]
MESWGGKIAIIGAGCTRFGENFDQSYDDMAVDATLDAVRDANIGLADIDGAWLSTAFPDAGVWKGRSGMDLAEPLALWDIPVTRVSNYCASAGDALRNACMALLSGAHDCVLALGVEKLRDRSPQGSLVAMQVETGHPFYQKGFTAPGTFSVQAARHFHDNGTGREDLAEISAKNHDHGALNPKAHYRSPMSAEQVLAAPMVADPLTVLDCCPTTDGAAAVILVRLEDAPKHESAGPPVVIRGQGFSVSAGWDSPFYDPEYRFGGFRASRVAGETAYREAEISDPREEIDLAEVHDCFSVSELMAYSDLGFVEPGESGEWVRSGATRLGGEVPFNTSGGLLSCGHPVGATGLRMLYQLTQQLRGTAGEMQVEGARVGLAHNIGGPGAVAAVTILEAT